MPMEKRNVVEQDRTPVHEEKRADADWDQEAAAEFKPLPGRALKRDEPSLRCPVIKKD